MLTVQSCILKSLPPVPILSHMNTVHAFPSCFLNIHFNIILPSICSLDSISIVTRLWVGQSGVQIPARTRDSFLQNVQTSRTKAAAYSIGTMGSLPRGVKLTSHLHLWSRLRMSAAIPMFPISVHGV